MEVGEPEPAQEHFCKHPAYPKCFAWFPCCTSISVRHQQCILSMVDSQALAIAISQQRDKGRSTSDIYKPRWGSLAQRASPTASLSSGHYSNKPAHRNCAPPAIKTTAPKDHSPDSYRRCRMEFLSTKAGRSKRTVKLFETGSIWRRLFALFAIVYLACLHMTAGLSTPPFRGIHYS